MRGISRQQNENSHIKSNTEKQHNQNLYHFTLLKYLIFKKNYVIMYSFRQRNTFVRRPRNNGRHQK